MEVLGKLLGLCIDFMKQPFNVYGYEVSFWGIFMLLAVVYVICLMIGGFIGGK